MGSFFKLEIDKNRVYGLDILRAMAILFVVIVHSKYILPKNLRPIINFLVFDGVSIFFVLSGFLIGGILIKLIEKEGLKPSTLRTFWIRRWFRTLPNYFLILVALSIIHFLFDDQFSFSRVYRYFFFSQNIFTNHPTWFFPEAWSLSVEEWFYLIFPLLLYVSFSFKKAYKSSILYVAVSLILFITFIRVYKFSYFPITGKSEWDLVYRKQVITRLDSLMFGVLGAYICFYYKDLWIKFKNKLLVTGILLFILSKYLLPYFTSDDGFYNCVVSFTLTSIATLFLIPYLSEIKSGNGIVYKSITYISLISYSMYLVNLSIVQKWIIQKIPWHNITDNGYLLVTINYAAYWVLVIGLSILIYKYFEVPMTSLRDRYKQ
jgi:peptidoglycan/LPS O-acetylase OafA/YrhL